MKHAFIALGMSLALFVGMLEAANADASAHRYHRHHGHGHYAHNHYAHGRYGHGHYRHKTHRSLRAKQPRPAKPKTRPRTSAAAGGG